MSELQAILAAFESSQNGETTFLATVVKTQGSTYRRPGARMLITSTSQMVGTISGGCLEQDVLEHTRQRMHTGEPIVVTYDTTADEDIVWGLGLGCNGVVQVLIERLDLDRDCTPMAFLQECLHNRQPGVLATVFAIEGSVRVKLGAYLTLSSDSRVNTDIQEPNLVAAIALDAASAKCTQQSAINQYQLSSGSVEVFIEVIQPLTHLIIFGVGYDAIPVVRFAKELGWHVTVVDSQPAKATSERFSMADRVILTRPEVVQERISVDSRTVAVVMTHNYLHDLELLKTLLPSPLGYLGILGPKSRTKRLLEELRQAGFTPTEDQLQRLYGPVGLDIGADTPEAIALSIVAEIQAVLANCLGGVLRDRKEPIHPRNNAAKLPLSMFGDQGTVVRS